MQCELYSDKSAAQFTDSSAQNAFLLVIPATMRKGGRRPTRSGQRVMQLHLAAKQICYLFTRKTSGLDDTHEEECGDKLAAMSNEFEAAEDTGGC